MRGKIVLGLLLAGALIASLDLAPVSAANFTVNVGQGGSNFSPSALMITRGDTVNWVLIAGGHTVTSGTGCVADGAFNVNPLTNAGFSRTFNTTGTFAYFCTFHCQGGMTGVINVNAPAEVPEADSFVLLLTGGAGLASFLGLKWRARKRPT